MTKLDDDEPARTSALSSADPIRNFSLSVEERIRAATIGAPAYALRKRRIEDESERLVGELVELHDKLVRKRRPESEIALALSSAATAIDFTKLNALVATHNRYYPMEANLPMSATGDYVVYGKTWLPEPPFSGPRLVALVRAALERRG